MNFLGQYKATIQSTNSTVRGPRLNCHPLGSNSPDRGTALKITLENWPYVQKKAREVGIENAEYNSKGELQAIVTKDCERFGFSAEAFEQFRNSGLLTLGRRIAPRT